MFEWLHKKINHLVLSLKIKWCYNCIKYTLLKLNNWWEVSQVFDLGNIFVYFNEYLDVESPWLPALSETQSFFYDFMVISIFLVKPTKVWSQITFSLFYCSSSLYFKLGLLILKWERTNSTNSFKFILWNTV